MLLPMQTSILGLVFYRKILRPAGGGGATCATLVDARQIKYSNFTKFFILKFFYLKINLIIAL